MRYLIIPMFAMLLIATSCRSKKIFETTDVQVNNTFIEQEKEEPMAASPVQEGKKAFFYHSTDKTVKPRTDFEVTKTIADLEVMPIKIEYSCEYNGDDSDSGRKNAVSYAIYQALKINGNADVMLEPKHEIKSENGRITSVKVSGYAAHYRNFRTATQQDLKLLKEGKGNTAIVSKKSQPSNPEGSDD